MIWAEKLPDSVVNWWEKREAAGRNDAGDGEMRDRLVTPGTKRVRLDRERARVWTRAESLLHMVVWTAVTEWSQVTLWRGEKKRNQRLLLLSFSRLVVFGEWENGNGKCLGGRRDGELVWWLMSRGGASCVGLTYTCDHSHVPRIESQNFTVFL